jgi:hypothetical protein
MGRGKGSSSFAHDHFDAGGLCLYVAPNGTRCTSILARRNAPGRAEHLKRHGIDETTPPPAAKGTVDIRIALKAMCPALTAQQHVLVLMCRFGLSNRIVDDEQFREVTNTKVSRNKVPELLGDIAETLIDAALPNFATCTLAIDVGTVHQRYLAFVLVNSNGRALFYTMVADTDERVNGHFTIPAVRAVVRDVLAALGRCQVNVCSIVADNASNLQGSVVHMIKRSIMERSISFHNDSFLTNDGKRSIWNV